MDKKTTIILQILIVVYVQYTVYIDACMLKAEVQISFLCGSSYINLFIFETSGRTFL